MSRILAVYMMRTKLTNKKSCRLKLALWLILCVWTKLFVCFFVVAIMKRGYKGKARRTLCFNSMFKLKTDQYVFKHKPYTTDNGSLWALPFLIFTQCTLPFSIARNGHHVTNKKVAESTVKLKKVKQCTLFTGVNMLCFTCFYIFIWFCVLILLMNFLWVLFVYFAILFCSIS